MQQGFHPAPQTLLQVESPAGSNDAGNNISYDVDADDDNSFMESSYGDGEAAIGTGDGTSPVEHTFPEGGLTANLVLAGSFIGLVANFGMLNSVGAIQTYLSINQLQHVKSLTVSWIFSIYFSLAYVGGIVVGPYFDARGAMLPLIGGLILIFGGFMAVANCLTVWQFILALSICVGVGNTLCITPLVGIVSHWFCQKRGVATGFATTGGSVGGIIIPLMFRGLYPKVGFAWAIRILAFFCLACMAIAIALVKGRPEFQTRINRNTVTAITTFISVKSGEPVNFDTNAEEEEKKSTRRNKFTEIRKKVGLLMGQGHNVRYFAFSDLLDVKYLLLIAGVFTEELSLMLMVTYLATYAVSHQMSESQSYILLTVFNASGIFGRWLPGYASDFIGHFNVMCLMLVGLCLSIFLLWLPFGSNHSILWVFSAFSGFFSSSILSLTPVCLGQITPMSKFGQRYGMLYFFVSVGNLFGLPIGAAIIGNKSEHNYDMFVVLVGVLAVVGTACWVGSRYCLVGFKIKVKV